MPPELKDKIPDLSDLKNNFREFKDVQLPIDILLLTVKDIEFQSCYFYLKDVFQSYEKDLGYVYFGEMGEVGNAKLKVALFKCSAKPGGALLAVMNTVRKLRPKAVFCVGCCGALHRDMTNLGDVIVSAKLTTFAQRQVTNQGVHPCGFSVPVSNDIGKIIQYASCGWKAPLKNPEERGSVKVHTDGEFLSGPEEIDSEERRRELVELYPNAIAIEKDGEGVFSAAQDLRMEWVVIKGISNYVDGTASFTEGWEPFACAMAASVVNNILRTPVVFKEWAHYKSSDTGRAQNEAQASARFNAEEGNGGSWDNILGSVLQSLTSESGQVNLKGRVICYRADGRFRGFQLEYLGVAWDVESGTSVKARHYKSRQGAIEHAVKQLIDELKAKGILS